MRMLLLVAPVVLMLGSMVGCKQEPVAMTRGPSSASIQSEGAVIAGPNGERLVVGDLSVVLYFRDTDGEWRTTIDIHTETRAVRSSDIPWGKRVVDGVVVGESPPVRVIEDDQGRLLLLMPFSGVTAVVAGADGKPVLVEVEEKPASKKKQNAGEPK